MDITMSPKKEPIAVTKTETPYARETAIPLRNSNRYASVVNSRGIRRKPNLAMALGVVSELETISRNGNKQMIAVIPSTNLPRI